MQAEQITLTAEQSEILAGLAAEISADAGDAYTAETIIDILVSDLCRIQTEHSRAGNIPHLRDYLAAEFNAPNIR